MAEAWKAYLLCVDDIHDDTTLQHACEACFDGEAVLSVG